MTENEREVEVRAAMRDLSRAFLARDVAALNEALDDDFTGYDPAGLVVSKAQWLADVASGDLRFETIQLDEIEFHHAEDSVSVRGQLTFRADYSRSSYNGSFRFLGVYANRDDRWKLTLSTARGVAAATCRVA